MYAQMDPGSTHKTGTKSERLYQYCRGITFLVNLITSIPSAMLVAYLLVILIGDKVNMYNKMITTVKSLGYATTHEMDCDKCDWASNWLTFYYTYLYSYLWIAFGLNAGYFGKSVLGLASMAANSKPLRIIYMIVEIIFLIGCIAGTSLLLINNNTVKSQFECTVKSSFNRYNGLNITNAETLIINYVQMKLKCCGIINYTDYKSLSQWSRTIVVETSKYNQTIPVSCCVLNEHSKPLSINQCNNPVETNFYYQEGCLNKMAEKIYGGTLFRSQEFSIFPFMISTILCLVFVIVLVICDARRTCSNSVRPVNIKKDI